MQQFLFLPASTDAPRLPDHSSEFNFYFEHPLVEQELGFNGDLEPLFEEGAVNGERESYKNTSPLNIYSFHCRGWFNDLAAFIGVTPERKYLESTWRPLGAHLC